MGYFINRVNSVAAMRSSFSEAFADSKVKVPFPLILTEMLSPVTGWLSRKALSPSIMVVLQTEPLPISPSSADMFSDEGAQPFSPAPSIHTASTRVPESVI